MSASFASLLRQPWWAGPNLFAAGLFCLVTAQFFGQKFLAVGQGLVFLSILATFRERGFASLEPGRWGASAKCLAAFLFVSFLSIVGNLALVERPVAHLTMLRTFVLFLLVLAMPALVGRNLGVPWRRDSLVLAWLVPLGLALLFGTAAAAGAVPGFGPAEGAKTVRISGFYGQVMSFAYTLQFSVLLLAILVFQPDLWRRVTRLPYAVAVGALIAAGAGLYFTHTRGAALGVVAGLVVHGAMRSRRLLAAVVAVALAAGLFAWIDGSRLVRRDASADLRAGHWRAAALAALERPVLGWGYRNFQLHSAELKERYGFEKEVSWVGGQRQAPSHLERHAHNNYLETFASTGAFGGIAFLAFCWCWVGECRRSRYGAVFAPLAAAFLVSGLFENTFFDGEPLNAILLAWLFSQWILRLEREAPGRVTPPAPA